MVEPCGFCIPKATNFTKGKSRSDQWDSVEMGVCGDTNPVPMRTSLALGYK